MVWMGMTQSEGDLMKRILMLLIMSIFLVAGCTAPVAKDNSAIDTDVSDDGERTDELETVNDTPVSEPNNDSTVQGVSIIEKIEMAKATYKGTLLAGTTTPYLSFTQEDYDEALKQNKVIVLNFYANWCPFCKNEEKEVFEAFDTINYTNVIGFRVNYKDTDTDVYEEELAKKYGVAYQHTKVIIKDGQRVLKAPDTWSKNRYLS